MIIDTSAVVAVLNNELERTQFEEIIAVNSCEISSVSLLEASIVLLCRRGEESLGALDTWVEAAGIEVVSFTPAHARLARSAYARFGKGRHPASLSFGDCATYALAIDRGHQVLFSGSGFSQTDVRCVISEIPNRA